MPTDLHVSLQEYYAGETGQTEAPWGRFKIDALRDGVAYEIQTGSFFQIKSKLEKLSAQMPVVVVYPLARTKHIVRVDPETNRQISSRRSPKQGQIYELFIEMRQIAEVLARCDVALEVAWTIEREVRTPETRRGRYHKRKAVIGRELVDVVETVRFAGPGDYLALLPENLPPGFSVADLAQAAGISRWLAGHVTYCLNQVAAIERVGKRGNAYLYGTVGASAVEVGGGWLPVRCSQCDTLGLEAAPGSTVRWRCPQCQSLEEWTCPGPNG